MFSSNSRIIDVDVDRPGTKRLYHINMGSHPQEPLASHLQGHYGIHYCMRTINLRLNSQGSCETILTGVILDINIINNAG